MLEAYGTLDQVMAYYGTPSAPGGHFAFNFRLITDVHYNASPPSSAGDISNTINEYLDRMTDGRTPNWVVRTCSVSRSDLFRRQDSRCHWRSHDPHCNLYVILIIYFVLIWNTSGQIKLRYVILFKQLRTTALRLIVQSWLDVPTFATRRLHACHHARAPGGGRWNYGREISGNFA